MDLRNMSVPGMEHEELERLYKLSAAQKLVDDMTVEEGARYPVMLGYGAGQKYDYICESVKDFRCAMYLTPEILEANPNGPL